MAALQQDTDTALPTPVAADQQLPTSSVSSMEHSMEGAGSSAGAAGGVQAGVLEEAHAGNAAAGCLQLIQRAASIQPGEADVLPADVAGEYCVRLVSAQPGAWFWEFDWS